MTAIQTHDLVREYHPARGVVVRALRGVDVEIERGAFTTVLGRSGSGKSTLLNLLGGLDRPSSGRVIVEEQDLGAMSSRALAGFRAEHVGFVFQSFHLQPRFLAWENVALPLVFQGVDRRTRRRRAEALLDRVGLLERATHRPPQLSGGEQQRVALARSLIGSPKLILGDEPTGNLDSRTAAQILELLVETNAAGTTVVIVSHDRELAARHADLTIEMDDGRISSLRTTEAAS